ncbi:J domain-containing protein [Aquaspirillum soli]
MKRIRTHYDNLKVARNAPPEVIRAAYKALSQRFHPDKNLNDPEAERIMVIINEAYDVLSDPEKRAEHDLWIAEKEKTLEDEPRIFVTPKSPPREPNPEPIPEKPSKISRFFKHLFNNYQWYTLTIIAGFISFLWLDGRENETTQAKLPPYQADPKPYQADSKPYQVNPPTPKTSAFVRPATAPNGSPWPTTANYIVGYPRLNNDGYSRLTVDNSNNESDVFVKLVSLDGVHARPVRHFYIPAFSRFTAKNVTAGRYDIRYRDLSSGELSRSELFSLQETRTFDGIQYSDFTMTLYKVYNGNMTTYSLSESDF